MPSRLVNPVTSPRSISADCRPAMSVASTAVTSTDGEGSQIDEAAAANVSNSTISSRDLRRHIVTQRGSTRISVVTEFAR